LAQYRIIAVGLLTQQDLDLLGPSFTQAWPVDEGPSFQGLLQAIDEADRQVWRTRNAAQRSNPPVSG